MRQTRTRILSLLLALVMCLGLLPVTAMAAGGSSGEPALFLAPYQQAYSMEGELGDVDFIIAPLSIRPPVYYNNGYTIEGWYDNPIYEIQPAPSNPPASANASATSVQSTVPISTDQAAQDTQYTLTVIIKLPDGTLHTTNNQYPAGTTVIFYEPSTGRITYKIISGTGSAASNPSSFALVEDSTLLLEASYKNININITYDYNGAGETVTRQVRYRSAIELPTPSLSGYRFLGWYQGKPEGQYLTNYYQFSGGTATKDITIYAMWAKESPSGFIVTFDPNGGTVLPTSKQTDADGRVPGGYPTPTREGYTFLGWFAGDGYKPADDEQWSGNQTLVAKWAVVDACMVTFFHNNGTGKSEQLKVIKGDTLKLPADPVWAKHTFLGWVSGKIVNGKITDVVWWTEKSKVTEDVVLYAAWADGEADETLKGLTYRFGNDDSDYGYNQNDQDYKIPLERYQLIFGENELAKSLHAGEKKWNGSCYGMCTTSTMFFENIVSTSSFKSGSTVPYDLAVSDQNSSLNLSLTQYIEAMQISQKAQRVQQQISQNRNNLSVLQTAVKSSPVIVTIFGPEGGHAVVGYEVKTVTNASGQSETGLMIYDPNYPNQEKHITLSGNNGWSYYLGKMYVNGKLVDVTWSSSNGWISYVPYTVAAQVWSDRGNEKNYYNTMNLVNISANNATISNSAGEVVATIKDGTISNVRGNVTPIYETDIAGSGSSVPAMWLPTDQYTVTNTGSESQFAVSMVNVEQSATVSTTASNVTFLVDDSNTINSVQMNGAGERYDITLSSTLDQGYKEVALTGTTSAETTAVAQISGKLYGTNLDTNGTLKVDGTNSDSSVLAGTVPPVSASRPTQPTGTNPFTDVKAGAYYYDAVLWAVEKNVTSGTSATTFSPDTSCTRGQIVTFLWRAAGSPKPSSTNNPFTDVKAGAYYYDAVLWAVEKGITSGTSATTFSPDASCTRGQTVTFLYRAAGSPRVASSTNPFTDVKSGTYYYDAVLWAVEKKVTSGTSATTFSPDATVTRGQTVTFLYRSQG